MKEETTTGIEKRLASFLKEWISLLLYLLVWAMKPILRRDLIRFFFLSIMLILTSGCEQWDLGCN